MHLSYNDFSLASLYKIFVFILNIHFYYFNVRFFFIFLVTAGLTPQNEQLRLKHPRCYRRENNTAWKFSMKLNQIRTEKVVAFLVHSIFMFTPAISKAILCIFSSSTPNAWLLYVMIYFWSWGRESRDKVSQYLRRQVSKRWQVQCCLRKAKAIGSRQFSKTFILLFVCCSVWAIKNEIWGWKSDWSSNGEGQLYNFHSLAFTGMLIS